MKFGEAFGQEVEIHRIANSNGIALRVMTLGAAIVTLETPDRYGHFSNIVLGVDDISPYLAGTSYLGATVGRYANRIAGGKFTLGGVVHRLTSAAGDHSLHGGARGFDKRIWSVERREDNALKLTYVSPDGEEGYPGKLKVSVSYRIGADDSLEIAYGARTTVATPVNLANHAYFNLTGDPTTTILSHVLSIAAGSFTPIDSTLIPTGELRPVKETAFDFRRPRLIGESIEAADVQLFYGSGYDHNWVLDKVTPNEMSLAATLSDPDSGRFVEISTTQPGLQFYSGNFLDGKPVPAGTGFAHRTGLCLETQHFPDSPNHRHFPDTILRPGQVYQQTTLLSFRTGA